MVSGTVLFIESVPLPAHQRNTQACLVQWTGIRNLQDEAMVALRLGLGRWRLGAAAGLTCLLPIQQLLLDWTLQKRFAFHACLSCS